MKNEEKWMFGVNPKKLSDYLNKFDITLIEDMEAFEYHEQ